MIPIAGTDDDWAGDDMAEVKRRNTYVGLDASGLIPPLWFIWQNDGKIFFQHKARLTSGASSVSEPQRWTGGKDSVSKSIVRSTKPTN